MLVLVRVVSIYWTIVFYCAGLQDPLLYLELFKPHFAICQEGTTEVSSVAEGSHFSYNREDELIFLVEGRRVTYLLDKPS